MGYIFDPDVLHQVVRDAVNLPLDEAFDQITTDLEQCYTGKIFTGDRNWIFNNAGGAMGQLTLLHGSLNEYLIFFGTPIGTEGHSGRYAADVWDFTIAGEMWCYVEGELNRTVYKPGSRAFLGTKSAKGYRVDDHLWVLEYARGPVYTMLPFGLADTLFSTLDVRTFSRTLYHYGRLVTRDLLGQVP